MIRLLVIGSMLMAATAFAQSVGEETTQNPNPPATPVSGEDEKVGLLQGKLESLEERLAASESLTAIFNSLKLSGYVQGRYQWAEASKDGGVLDGFSVRRGRFKAEYKTPWAAFMIQTDATGKGVTLKDAEATLMTPWTGEDWKLTLGQTKWPFGYEIVQSSSDREMPERSRVIGAFGPGERDRGAKLSGKWKFLRLSLGLFDGNGTGNVDLYTAKAYSGVDNDVHKDVVGRLGVDFGFLAVGVSGWTGETYRPDNKDTADDNEAKIFTRDRIGADFQLYLDLLPFGSTAIKGEFIQGHTWQKSGVEQFGILARGFYAVLIQNIGLSNAIAIRFDSFDPNVDLDNAVDSSDSTKPSSSNTVNTLGFALIHYWNEVLRVTLAFEIPMTATVETAKDPEDMLLTLQLQAKF